MFKQVLNNYSDMFSTVQIKKIREQLKTNYNEQMPLVFAALGDHCRFFIFHLLISQKEVCVTDVAKICKITVSAASQQLKNLELSGLIKKERMGQMVCYSLKKTDPLVMALVKILNYL